MGHLRGGGSKVPNLCLFVPPPSLSKPRMKKAPVVSPPVVFSVSRRSDGESRPHLPPPCRREGDGREMQRQAVALGKRCPGSPPQHLPSLPHAASPRDPGHPPTISAMDSTATGFDRSARPAARAPVCGWHGSGRPGPHPEVARRLPHPAHPRGRGRGRGGSRPRTDPRYTLWQVGSLRIQALAAGADNRLPGIPPHPPSLGTPPSACGLIIPHTSRWPR